MYVMNMLIPAEKVTPSSELDLMNSYICDSGTVIQEHCKTGGKCDASSLTECDYVESSRLP